MRTLCALMVAVPLGAAAQEVSFDVSGADALLRTPLQNSSLVFKNDTKEAEDLPAAEVIAMARADYKRLVATLYQYGYYGGSVSILIDGQEAAQIDPFTTKTKLSKIDVRVKTGPQYVFGEVRVTPAFPAHDLDEAQAQAASNAMKMLSYGQAAALPKLKAGAAASLDLWKHLGFAKARIQKQQIKADHRAKQLQATVMIEPGRKLTFGPVQVQGAADVDAQNVLKIAGIRQGEDYSPRALEEAKGRLRRSGAFKSVTIEDADAALDTGQLPLTVRVAERKPRRFGAGFEFSTVRGPVVSGYWLHRNFFGGAEQFRVEGKVLGFGASQLSGVSGGTDYSLGASLRQPAIWGPKTDLNSRITIEHSDEQFYQLSQISAQSLLTRRVKKGLVLEGGAKIDINDERTALSRQRYVLLSLPLMATLDRRDDAKNPQKGYYVNASFQPFVDAQGGRLGARAVGDVRAYQHVQLGRPVTFAGRAQIGTMVLSDSTSQAPADFLFFSGGGDSVRGQDYQSLGVVSQSGAQQVTTGGQSRISAQLEARVAVTKTIEAVSFFDIGAVSASSNPFDYEQNWHSGIGLGVRYQTGLGPIRVDIATPSNGDQAFKTLDFYIGIGQAF